MRWKPLNPARKAKKYAYELKNNIRVTNNNVIKTDKVTGEALPMTDKQKAYRIGYLAARKDNARCYTYKQRQIAATNQKLISNPDFRTRQYGAINKNF